MDAKKYYPYISLVVFMLIIAAAGFAGEEVIKSMWPSQPLMIDGLADDWTEVVLTTEKSVEVDYAFRNDAQNMYVIFVFKNPKYLSTINATGITLYFNTEGKKKKDHGIHFNKKQVTPEELIAYMEKQGEVVTEEQRQSIKSKPGYMAYMVEKVGKKDKDASEAAQTPVTSRPNFRINQKGKELVFEFQIPLAKSETSPEGIGVEPGQNIKIGFEWGGMTEELLKRMGARTGGDISRESGAGSVIDSRRSTGSAPSGRSVPKKHSFWIDVQLAQNQ